MTKADKAAFLESTKREMKKLGVPWSFIEKKLRAEIDATFDDEKFARMAPDRRIDAENCRKEFREKPDLVDYLLWTGKFVTHSDVVEW